MKYANQCKPMYQELSRYFDESPVDTKFKIERFLLTQQADSAIL